MKLAVLDPLWGNTEFPPPAMALEEPNGLLAVGGDLNPERILAGYQQGIFPWYDRDFPILWWAPDPRAVIPTAELYIPRRFRRELRRHPFRISLDRDFSGVVAGCAEPRPGSEGTWIHPEMKVAYDQLHERGYAHSIEVWCDGRLVGGLYGVCLGRIFFGESMFSRRTGASKVALTTLIRQLARWDFPLLDCQLTNPHLEQFGCREIPREEFQRYLEDYAELAPATAPWTLDPDLADTTGWQAQVHE